MIDEAQHLDPAVLEQIRLLSNFETDDAKLLQIVLVGQPDLDTVLARPDMRQLNQRVARRIQLDALSGHEVSDYVARRLSVASGDSDARLEVTAPFTTDAMAAVQQISRGVPRVINILCDRALEIGMTNNHEHRPAGHCRCREKTPAVPAADDAASLEGAGRCCGGVAGDGRLGGWWWSARAAGRTPAAGPRHKPSIRLRRRRPRASSVSTAAESTMKPTGTDGTAGLAVPAREHAQGDGQEKTPTTSPSRRSGRRSAPAMSPATSPRRACPSRPGRTRAATGIRSSSVHMRPRSKPRPRSGRWPARASPTRASLPASPIAELRILISTCRIP